MKRYGVILLAVITAALGIGAVALAAKKSSKPAQPPKGAKIVAVNKTVTVNCTVRLQNQIPADQTQFVRGSASGTQYGGSSCDKYVGNGVGSASFADQDSGDTTGLLGLYAPTGAIGLAYDLTPNDDSSTNTGSFTSTDETGTLTLVNASGSFDGVTLKKDSGTEECTSDDSLHYTCKLSMTLVLPTEYDVVG